jgi:adenine-specific DNA-methyltransferase
MQNNSHQNKKKLNECSQVELIEIIKQLRKRKKYGLVWEDKPERVVEQCKKELPVLDQDENMTIENSQSGITNLMIEGDNYHTLSVLNYTHARKIDVIYIDPPYNTGSKDFIYNDTYVDKEDRFRHSKWLSFLSKRLALSKNLLTPNGYLAISIDDNEFAQLKMLLDEIFQENVKTIVIKMSEASGLKMSAIKKTGSIPKYKEYLLIAKPSGIKNLFFKQIPKESWDDEYNIYIDNFTKEDRLIIDELSEKEDIDDTDLQKVDSVLAKVTLKSLASELKSVGIKTTKEKNNWCFDNAWRICRTAAGDSVKTLADIKKKKNKQQVFSVVSKRDRVLYIVKSDYSSEVSRPRVQILFADTYLSTHPGDLWTDIKTTGLEAEGGVSFKNGKKPLELIKRIITASGNKKAIILDFFAGSGTTAQATLELNKEDGGSRQFIIATNNEGDIAKNITYPRVKESLSQSVTSKSLSSNLRYFRTSFVTKNDVSDDTRRELVRRSTEMICVRENTFNKKYDNKDYKIYTNGKVSTGIIFDLDCIDEFKEKIDKLQLPARLYVFSLTNDTYESDFADLSVKHKLCAIPESILEVYRKLFI